MSVCSPGAISLRLHHHDHHHHRHHHHHHSPAISQTLYKPLTISMVFKYLLPNKDKQLIFLFEMFEANCFSFLHYLSLVMKKLPRGFFTHFCTDLLIEHNMQQQEWLYTLYTISINFLFRALQRLWRGIISNLLFRNHIHIYSSQWWMFMLLIMIQR